MTARIRSAFAAIVREYYKHGNYAVLLWISLAGEIHFDLSIECLCDYYWNWMNLMIPILLM